MNHKAIIHISCCCLFGLICNGSHVSLSQQNNICCWASDRHDDHFRYSSVTILLQCASSTLVLPTFKLASGWCSYSHTELVITVFTPSDHKYWITYGAFYQWSSHGKRVTVLSLIERQWKSTGCKWGKVDIVYMPSFSVLPASVLRRTKITLTFLFSFSYVYVLPMPPHL
jgi:hypothetical protein